jgi:hypothetical protein
MPPIQLNSPIVTSVANVTVLAFTFRFASGVLQAYVAYTASDTNDVPVPGADVITVGPLALADLAAFYSAGAHPKLGALAALLSNQPQLAGAVT